MASDPSVRSRTPALNAAAQPTATAGLFGDSPASAPPAPPNTIRLPRLSRRLSPVLPDSIQATHAAADRPSMIAMARPRAPSESGRGLASETVTITTTRPQARTRSITRLALTTRAPVTGSLRVAKPNTLAAPDSPACLPTAINVARHGPRAAGRRAGVPAGEGPAVRARRGQRPG